MEANGDGVHITAKDGFKEGAFYDKWRPSFSDELVNHVIEHLYHGRPNVGIKYNVLELGAGTGKFTSKILNKLHTGMTFLATDPSEGFLSVLKENVPGVETAMCASSDIPLPDQSVENIICAQCFHWFATEESLKEMTRVLVPQGRIVLVWNSRDNSVGWVKEIETFVADYMHYTQSPRYIDGQWQVAIEACTTLSCVDHTFLPGIRTLKGSKEYIVNYVCTFGAIAILETKERDSVRARLHAVLDKHFPDALEITFPFQSVFYCAKKNR